MFFENKEPNWEELYDIWNSSCWQMRSSITKTPNVAEIEVDSPARDWKDDEYIDWWRNDEFDKRKKAVEKYGAKGVYQWGKTNSGTRTTASLLWDLKDDPEGMALTWIAASMWDKSKDLPYEWRGELALRVQKLLNVTRELLANKSPYSWFHSAKGALPVKIHNNPYMDDILIPNKYSHLVVIAAMENVISHSNHTIVRITAK